MSEFWFYASGNSRVGPLSEEAMRQRILMGKIIPGTKVWRQGLAEWVLFEQSELAKYLPKLVPPPLPAESGSSARERASRLVGDLGGLTDKVLRDLRDITPQLLMPFEEFRAMRWLDNKRLLSLAAIGLWPVVCLALFNDIRSAFWAMALYFSVLWAVFFYYVFPSDQVRRKTCVLCFFWTGVVSITLLLLLQRVWPLTWLLPRAFSGGLASRYPAMFLGVGLPEELCKALVVAFVVRTSPQKLPLQAALYYGLMSGLGFGIYEGVSYQMGRNLLADNIGQYYLLNLLRLTTLPFLHSMWTGIAGYFIGLAALYPRRQVALYVAALCIPAFLHSSHNTFSSSAPLLGLAVDFFSVLALLVYLAKSSEFQTSLDALEPEGLPAPGSSPAGAEPPPAPPENPFEKRL